jgi:hypothetical protein
MQIDESAEHTQNSARSRQDRTEPDSKARVERHEHSLKQAGESVRRDDGRHIDGSDEHRQNTPSSMHETCEPRSNVTVESDVH